MSFPITTKKIGFSDITVRPENFFRGEQGMQGMTMKKNFFARSAKSVSC